MGQLNIDGLGTVTVDDSFAKLSPDQQKAFVADVTGKIRTGAHSGGGEPLGQAPAAPDSTAMDVAKSTGSGLVRGAAELAAAPVALPKMAADAIVGGGEWLARKALGLGPVAPDTQAKRDQAAAAIANGPITSPDVVAHNVLTNLNGQLHTPQTTAGRYAGAVAEMVPAAVAGPGGLLGEAGAAVRAAPTIAGKALEVAKPLLANAAAPGVASESAGQAVKGTDAEPLARLAGALFGGGVTAAVASRAGASGRLVADAVHGVSTAEFDAAQQLQHRAAAMGVPLSGPEAIQAVTGGASKLGDVQRVVEGSTEGGARTARYYAARPGQVQDASGRVFDQIAPASAAPSTIGPQAAEAAQGALDGILRGINTATQPAYRAAEAHTLAPADFAPIERDPAFRASLARLRADPVLGPTYEHLPDNSVGVIDAVTKDMGAQGRALGNAANPGFQPQKAAMFDRGAAEARDIARDPARGGVQAYDDALAAQEQARRQNLTPRKQGPLGQIAAAGDTRAATEAFLPSQPLVGGHAEVADAAAHLAAQHPTIVPALVRQHLADAMDDAGRQLQSGPNQYAGANFAKTVAGTPQQRANLDAVFGTIPGAAGPGGSAQRLADLLEVFRATGQRKLPGSATEFNRQTTAALGQEGLGSALAQTAATVGLSLPGLFGKIAESSRQAALARNASTLAQLFLAPDSAEQIGRISARGARAPIAAMLVRQGLQAPGEVEGR